MMWIHYAGIKSESVQYRPLFTELMLNHKTITETYLAKIFSQLDKVNLINPYLL